MFSKEKIDKKVSCRYTFVAFTTFQLVSSEYYAYQLKKYNPNVDITLVWENLGSVEIDITPLTNDFDHIHEAYVSDKDYHSGIMRQLYRVYYHGHFFIWSPIGKLYQKKRLRNKEILIIFSDQHLLSRRLIKAVRRAKNSNVIMAEEGIANYSTEKVRWIYRFGKEYFPISLIIFPLLGLDTVANHGTSGLYDALMVRYPEKVPSYKAYGFKMIRQKAFWNDVSFIERLKNHFDNQFNFDESNKMILWLGCPGDGLYRQELQYALITKIASRLPKGYVIYIKAHPRENVYDYKSCFNTNVRPLDLKEFTLWPIEVLISILNPVLGLSLVSSAGFNMTEMGYQHRFVYDLLECKEDSYIEKIKRIENVEGFSRENDAVFSIEEIISILNDNTSVKNINTEQIDELPDDVQYLISL